MSAISFIVPTFNRARFLGEALSAILAQMRDEDELIVIDDGSTDDSAAVVAAAGARARYVRQENSGKAVALNRAMAMTSAPLVWICDDDDILRAGAVETLVAAMADDRIGFSFGRYTRFRDRPDGSREDMGTGYWPDLSRGSLARHILDDAFVMQNAALVRRSAYAAVGPFSEAMPRSLDYEMFVRLAISHPCVYVDQMMFDQRKHDGARGPAALQHAAARSDQVWQQYDRLIFAHLHRHAPIAFFEAMFDGDDMQRRRRAALLCRGTIMMRHGCWDEAVADLHAAAALPLPALDATEVEICKRAFAGKHCFDDLLTENEALRGLADLGRTPAGREIVRAMLAGTLWRIRRGLDQERRATMRLTMRLTGWHGGMALLASYRKRPTGRIFVEERRDLAPGAWIASGRVPPVGAKARASAA